jgi:hypothetical protein
MRAKSSFPKTTVQRYTIEVVFHKIGAEPDLQVIPKLHAYLRAGLHPDQGNGQRMTNGVPLGRLGSMSVSIIQGDEFATRWFIIINGKADAVVRFTLDAADVEMIVEALRQVMEDLPASE